MLPQFKNFKVGNLSAMLPTDLTQNDIKQILSSYSVGTYNYHNPLYISPKRILYLIKTSSGKYVVKVFEKFELDHLLFTISVQKFVIKKNFPIPRIEHTKNGEPFSKFKGKGIIIQKFLAGRHPKRYSDRLIKNMASTFAKLNKTLMQYPLQEKCAWKIDYHFQPSNTNAAFNFNMNQEQEKLICEMSKLIKSKLRRSIIHGDLSNENYLVHKQNITAIIDWEKCREDYIAYDIAVFLIGITGKLQNKVSLYLQEYEKYLQLNYEERKAIYYFMKIHMLVILNWLKKILKKQPDKEISINKKAQQIIQKYLALNKLTVEQFMNLP